MKTDLVDVNETRKQRGVRDPDEVVDAEIVASRATSSAPQARIPGFRPQGAGACHQAALKDQILHDVAHGLIPRAVTTRAAEKGRGAVDTPDIR